LSRPKPTRVAVPIEKEEEEEEEEPQHSLIIHNFKLVIAIFIKREFP